MKKSILLILILMFTAFIFSGCMTKEKEEQFFIGETMPYEDVDVIVNSVFEQKINSGDYTGKYKLKVFITLKNFQTKDFKFPYSDVYIKTADTNQKYEVSYGFNDILGHTIMSGASESFELSFYTPYSLNEKKFVIVFDWGLLSSEKEYFLYMRNGNNYIGFDESQEKKYYLYDMQTFDDIEYTFNKFQKTNSIPSTLGGYIKPDDNDSSFFAVKIHIKNNSTTTKNLYLSDWSIIMDETSAVYTARNYVFQYDSLSGESLQPYEEKTYLIIFQVPNSVINKNFSLRYRYEDTLLSGDKYTYWSMREK